ncbi:phosphotyrosine protein phosphatase [Suillus paluster]|uniref:phosphotyrosine protein phosphatase n=1 Tax=Suillus paluster TaxID=48578 RepID=UPI001B885C8B|nr:phosphotyrosine protein phosphatase [Suillus paluster]KAG1728529.1 phosphotyrosine protein phosphatase [Suillus paluster]
MTISVLIVCLGNICRSPMGEAVLRNEALKRGITDIHVDSAGTAAAHVGEDPDERTIEVCNTNNVPISHAARQVRASDFTSFNYILAADGSNLRALERHFGRSEGSEATVRLWGSYLSDNKPIQDPYYGGMDGFTKCYEQCVKLSNAFLDEVVGKGGLGTR